MTTVRDARVEQALKRRVQNAYPSIQEATERISSESGLTFYLGIDPTGPIHLGHAIPLLLLRDLQSLGHTIVVLIGDFTARIGDPTDKSATRTALTEEQVRENMELYLDRISRILPEGTFTVQYNNDWLSALSFQQVIKLTSMVTVQQLIQRDMFQERLKNEKPIHISEFLYPLMQGYDSVAMRVDGEVGGNDQTFNMLMGRTLEKEILGKDKLVLATYLLADPATGKKMSKTEGILIALTDSPQEMRRKVLALDDSLTETVFRLCTTQEEAKIVDAAAKGPRAFKEALAAELVRMFYGEDVVSEAVKAVEIVGAGMPLDHVLKGFLEKSMTEIKTLITQGAVSINDGVVSEWSHEVKSGDIIKVGKGKLGKVK